MFVPYLPISKVIVFLINVTGLTLIISVVLSDLHVTLKRVFSLMGFSMFVWVNFAFFARLTENNELGLVFIRLAWSITPFLFVLIFSFISTYLNYANKYKLVIVPLYLIGVLFAPLILQTDFIIKDILVEGRVLTIIYGSLVWLFFGIVAFLTSLSFFILYKGLKDKEHELIKKNIEYLMIGLGIFFVANSIFNIYFPVFRKIFYLYEFGDYSTIVFLSITAYATVKHELLGTKIVSTLFLVVFLALFILIDALIFGGSSIERLLKLFIFIFYIPFGYLLVRSVFVEIEQRQELQVLNQKLKALDKQKDEFINMAAHELRAPMTAIKGYISMILEGDVGEIPEKAKGYLTDVTSVNERLIRLVNNMLDVSRIEEGRLIYNTEVVKLSDIAKSVHVSFKFEAERKGLSFKLNIPEGIKDTIEVDSDRLNEVIGNFVSNSVKYTEQGGIEINISQPSPDRIRLGVKDTGPGISKPEQEKLFQKFYRIQSAVGKTIGTGLGLYISKLLIERFNGQIGLISDSGKGSEFWFELPVSSKPVGVSVKEKKVDMKNENQSEVA